jgi:hypothetical protein
MSDITATTVVANDDAAATVAADAVRQRREIPGLDGFLKANRHGLNFVTKKSKDAISNILAEVAYKVASAVFGVAIRGNKPRVKLSTVNATLAALAQTPVMRLSADEDVSSKNTKDKESYDELVRKNRRLSSAIQAMVKKVGKDATSTALKRVRKEKQKEFASRVKVGNKTKVPHPNDVRRATASE